MGPRTAFCELGAYSNTCMSASDNMPDAKAAPASTNPCPIDDSAAPAVHARNPAAP